MFYAYIIALKRWYMSAEMLYWTPDMQWKIYAKTTAAYPDFNTTPVQNSLYQKFRTDIHYTRKESSPIYQK